MKRFPITLSIFMLFSIFQFASAQLTPGPSHPKPPPHHLSCLYNLCTGDTVFNVERNYRKAMIVGIEPRGTYVLRFLDNNGIGGNWGRRDLATAFGCGRQFCVGDLAFNIPRNYRKVRVIGIEHNGTYVLHFLDTNGVGGRWGDFDLIHISN